MKKRILFGLTYIFSSFFVFSSVIAGNIEKFEVELSPDSAKSGEALDLTIKAVDKNGAIVKDYTGTVLIFSESNPEAVLPSSLENASYKFKESDQGVKKFENGVKFTKSGTQSINVYDYGNDNFSGRGQVKISDSGNSGKTEIDLISPEEGLTIGTNKIKVSGSTVKNHKVKIILNGTENVEVTSNNNGIFEKEIENLKSGENSIKAQVLDADNNVLGETKEVKIKSETNGIHIKSVKIIPEEVFIEGPYKIELVSESGLKEVNAIVNDSVIKLKEEGNGIYKGNSFAPKNPGTYKVDVNLLNDLGHKINELGVASLKVKELNAALSPAEKTSTGELNSPGEKEVKKRDALKITGIKLVELKTKSILTWDKLENAKSYNVYKKNQSGELDLITTVNEPKFEINIEGDKVKFEDFYIRANGEDENGSYLGDLSDPTKIKTGPEMLIILIISLFFAGMFLFFKGRKS